MTKTKKDCGNSIKLKTGLEEIATKLCTLQEEGKKLGLFMEDREFLQCPKCKLLEDVLFDGRLVVYREGKEIEDTGLRFRSLDNENHFFECPVCKTHVVCESEKSLNN